MEMKDSLILGRFRFTIIDLIVPKWSQALGVMTD